MPDHAELVVRAETIAADGTRTPLTLDGPELTLAVTVHEVETTIPCGYQVDWISGEDDDGIEFRLGSGAGFGSFYATFQYGDRQFSLDGRDLIRAFVAAAGETA